MTIESLFLSFLETLTGGIMADFTAILSFGVVLTCIFLAFRLVTSMLSEIAGDRLYEKYNGEIRRPTRSENRAESRRQQRSFDSYISKNRI